MPKVTREHLDARRRQVLTAAHRCFARHGLHATTMQAIADEAGLSAGALYRYFDGKESLIEALADWGRELKREALAGLKPGGGAEALARVVSDLLQPLAVDAPETEATIRLDVRLWGEALDQPRIRRLFRDQRASLKGPIADFLRAERKAGRVRHDVDPEAAADAVFALLAGLELQRALDPELDVSRYTETLSMLLRSLAASDRSP
ncbi:MAG: TetR family transcriptional regulator [Thermoanaerobaculia bacterium]